ncbi:hypothetical protein ILUMI_13763 [Ignelater luminosus]|uniref:Uncharacterized protein n=1 Tax=Ignelater luminosus TaxID=2038154 RepID=A0A8K0GBL8_IGNLU|nr:hypothetical protein ILUMI_13763 [Ignelater luminosus]
MVLETQPTTRSKKSKLNYAAVWGTSAAGRSYAYLEKLSVLDVPDLSRKCSLSTKESWLIMELAGKEELEIAKASADTDADGTPYITVFLDRG